MWKSKKVTIIASVITSFIACISLSYAATVCTCQDICDIDNAADVARAAQSEYLLQIMLLSTADKDSIIPTWNTPGRFADVQSGVQKRVNDASAKCSTALNLLRGDTHGGTCNITVSPTSACMTEFTMAHELVHQSMCQSISHFLAYQMYLPLAGVLLGEIKGYQTTIDLQKTLKQGPLKDCCCQNRCTPTTLPPPPVAGMWKLIVSNLVK